MQKIVRLTIVKLSPAVSCYSLYMLRGKENRTIKTTVCPPVKLRQVLPWQLTVTSP